MTFDQIVSRVMYRLNLTSETSRTSVEEGVNDRYKRVTSSIGLVTSRRVILPFTIDPTDVDSTLPDAAFEGLEKILKISLVVTGRNRNVNPLTYEEITELTSTTLRALPNFYAVKRMGSGVVTVTFDAYPEDPFDLLVEGYEIADVLEDDAEPAFPADFHDILIEGAMGDELRKMEKLQLAQVADNKYEARLSDLRMFIIKNAYLDIVKGKRPKSWFVSIYD